MAHVNGPQQPSMPDLIRVEGTLRVGYRLYPASTPPAPQPATKKWFPLSVVLQQWNAISSALCTKYGFFRRNA